MAPDIAAQIREEQVKVLYRQARVVFVPNMIACPAIVYVLWNALPHGALLAWLGAMYVVTAARALLVWLHGRRERSQEDNRRWGWALAAMNMVSGSGWGTAGYFFVGYSDPLGQAFVIVTLAAMASGAVGSLSAFFPAYAMFAIACVSPLIARTLVEWQATPGSAGTTYLLLGILSLVYLTVHLVFSRNTERALVESIRLRFEKLLLVEQLTVQKERAEAANVAKSKFLAAASHDLRQPMHALGLFIDALRNESHATHAARLVDKVTDSHAAATGLLDNLLEFSKVDAGILKPVVTSFPVQRLFDQLRAEYELQASAAELELRIVPCSACVRSDPILLGRMLGNLVSNAIRYTDEGRILIGCRRLPGHVRIEVIDTGIGIPVGEHHAIFREFYQVDGARRRRRAQGMGLGLAIVSGLAQALEHTLRISSIPGKGSVFAVKVPLGAVASDASANEAGITDNLAGRVVLVIDDEPAIRDAVCEVLRRWHCEPIAAGSAADAVRLVRQRGRAPDAMIVDYQLEHGESGLDAIVHLEAAFGAGVPAVVVTGDTQPERLREANDIGYPLLYKPLAPMRLRAALSAALASQARSVIPAEAGIQTRARVAVSAGFPSSRE